jgi:serine/threonine protein kinase
MQQHRVKKSSFIIGDKLGAKGQGKVFLTNKRLQNPNIQLVYKEYLPETLLLLDSTVLESMVDYLHCLNYQCAMELLSICAWPCFAVENNNQVIGILMPKAPDEFYFNFTYPSGKKKRIIGEFQYLLEKNEYLAKHGISLSDSERKQLIVSVAKTLNFLHSRNIFVGDFSPLNLLFALSPFPKVFFLDCDSMRFNGRSALPQSETPGWEYKSHSGGELASETSDNQKLALLTTRLFEGDQETRKTSLLSPKMRAWLNYEIVKALNNG